MTAGRSHVVAALALFNEFKAAADRKDPSIDQKILLGKLAGEFVSSLEDLAALGWAIRRRRLGGVLRHYVGYGQARPGLLTNAPGRCPETNRSVLSSSTPGRATGR